MGQFIFGNPNSPQQKVAKPPIIAQTTPPTVFTNPNQFSLGDIWVDSQSNVVYVLTSISGGELNWVNTIPASGGTFSDLTVSPGPTSITGEFRVNANINEANVIELKENGGASGTIHIISEQGTGTASIGIVSTSGGINVETVATGKDIQLNADLGSIALAAGEDVDQAVFISAGGGTSATMQMINLSGTAPATAVASSSLFLSSTDGGVGINAGKDFNLQAVDTSLIEVSTGDLNITTDTGSINFTSAGGIDWQITGDVDLDVTGAISLDATLASNFTVTGAAADLTLESAGGSVNVIATEAAADAIFINATAGGIQEEAAGVILISSTDTTGSDVTIQANGVNSGVLIQATDTGGNVTIKPGGSLEMAGTATVTTIDLGNITPTVARTTTINGGGVVAAHIDTLNLATGGVSTNAGATKTVNIASGTNLLGTQTVNIASGTAASGTSAVNISTNTGGGTKTVAIGNADALTTITALGTVHINTSGAGATTIGSTATGGAVVIDSASSIDLEPVTTLTMAGNATVTTIDLGNFTPTVNRTTTINGGLVNTAHVDTVNIATGGVSTSGSAEKLVNIASGATAVGLTLLNIGSGDLSAAGNTTLNIATGDAPAGTTQAVNIGTGTGGGTKSINIGSATDYLTNVFANGVVAVNTASSTATSTIGNTSAGGAVALNSASTITSLAPNVNLNNSGTGATTIGSATGGTIIAESNTAAATAIQLNAHNAAGGITATVGTGNFLIGGGNLSLTTAAKGILFAAGPTIVSGAGSPNGSITATKGSLYLRTDGSGVNDRMYVNTDAGTTWTAVVTVA